MKLIDRSYKDVLAFVLLIVLSGGIVACDEFSKKLSRKGSDNADDSTHGSVISHSHSKTSEKPHRKVISYYIENSAEPESKNFKINRDKRDYPISAVPGKKITHLNYSFLIPGKVGDNYECVSLDEQPLLTEDLKVKTDLEASQITLKNLKYISKRKDDPDHPLWDVKVSIAIGGWDGSKYFGVAATEKYRDHFVKSCVSIVKHYGLDGLDIDWEYPVAGGRDDNYRMENDQLVYTERLEGVPQEKELFVDLIKLFRTELDKLEKPQLLTIATPIYTGPEQAYDREFNKLENYDFPAIIEVLDWINIMTYDAMGAWDYFRFQKVPDGSFWSTQDYHDGRSIDSILGAKDGKRLNRWAAHIGHQSPLYPMKKEPSEFWDSSVNYLNVDETVKRYLSIIGELNSQKLVVGIPFYGRGWAEVPNNSKVFSKDNEFFKNGEGEFSFEFNCDFDITADAQDTGKWLTADFSFLQAYPVNGQPLLETCISAGVPRTLDYSVYQGNPESYGGYMNSPGTYEAGAYDSAHVRYLIAQGQLSEYFDTKAMVPFAYGETVVDQYGDKQSETKGLFISYENERSVAAKADFVLKNKLGGVMFWVLDADYDYEKKDYPLLNAINGVFAKEN
ncbi:glycoside hydrolase family 18 protein [Pseudobacteriovorax antillogorgiicola]|uniref:chitinase n=1 Tax=Pseudobacteriovorax antillogorgiicola TaxID=1513793 RepID=A0A1Y6BNJ0_9BACT|nr:glycoside hydrolase family 18 protein [Pseudobacteriovorax antillogorgiicola]TCS54645.1 GH18 family chitinase [Pseudobacteriovorax antillogorgiicola]SMF16955.1 Chitinase, GH18 family [Pseudobacteriovorax antillogorgiicola]